MKLNPLIAISPIDGRYHEKTKTLQHYFSEFALMKYRVLVEARYLESLSGVGIPELSKNKKKLFSVLNRIVIEFSETDAMRIKNIEKTTNHDVKAVEYFLKEKLKESGLKAESTFVHFALTSQDINNTAIPLSFKDYVHHEYLPFVKEILGCLKKAASDWKSIPMLAHTHGQPASPTRLGKEMGVFAERIENQVVLLKQIPFSAKFGGATGNFNAHAVSYPGTDWKKFADRLVEKELGLSRSKTTTQIEHYDHLAAHFDAMRRINIILTDLSRDIWSYISMGYFIQTVNKSEVGSSAMPHKVNPIDFENAEGNFGFANAIFGHLAEKLPVSRLQRDLTDSTVLRNLGVPIAHTMIAFSSLIKGLGKIQPNREKIKQDLEENWAVVSEAIQTILKSEGIENAYELLKDFSRGTKPPGKSDFKAFIDSLAVPDSLKSRLRSITPHNYTGI